MNGLDLNLSLSYNSGSAMRGSGSATFYANDVTQLNYRNIALGWELNLPYISRTYQPVYTNTGDTFYTYRPTIKMADGGFYELTGDFINVNAEQPLGIINYNGSKLDIIHKASPNEYVVTYAEDGHKEYFDGVHGNLVKIVDKYGNKIEFNYSTLSYNACANVDMTIATTELVVLSSIEDSVGRIISFDYTIGNYVGLCGTYSQVENITISVNEKFTEDSIAKTYAQIALGREDTDHGAEADTRYKYADKILSITDADNKTTTFNTESANTYANDNSGSYNSRDKECDVFFALCSIVYPTGGHTGFAYSKFRRYMHYVYESYVYVPGPNYGEEYTEIKKNWYDVYKSTEIWTSPDLYTKEHSVYYVFNDDYFGCNLGSVYVGSRSIHDIDQNKDSVSYIMDYGNITKYEFNNYGDLLKETTYPSGKASLEKYCEYVTDYAYHPTYHTVTNKTYTVKDCVRNGGVLTETADVRWSESYTYDTAQPLVTSYTDKLGNRTDYTYFTYPTYSSNMLATETQYANKSASQRVVTTYELTTDNLNYEKVTTNYGNEAYTTIYTYDTNFKGNVVRQEEYHTSNLTEPDIVKTYSYNDVDDITNTNGRNAFITKEAVLDVETNSASFTDSTNDIVTYYKYGDAGRVASSTDAEGNTTTYTYNNCGDITNVKTPDNRSVVTTYTYSSTGENRIYTVVKNTMKSFKYYDGLGRLYYEASGKGFDSDTERAGEVWYYYDDGRLEHTRDGLGNFVYYSYDGFGRVISELHFSSRLDPETGEISSATAYAYTLYEYDDCIDVSGRASINGFSTVTSSATVNKGGKTSTVYYDAYGREVMTQTGEKKTYTVYNAKGNVEWTGDNFENTVYYTYDNRNLTTAVDVIYQENEDSESETATTTYEYDVFGNPTSVTTPAGKETTYEYDSLGRLIKETDPMGYTEEYAYDKVGNVISKKDKSGGVSNNIYNNMYYLTSTTTGDLSTTYTYDNIGRLLRETNENGTTVYTYYYNRNSLVSVTYPDGNSISYTYDAMENISSITDYSGTVFNYNYDPLYNIDYIVSSNYPVVDYTYDASGCMTKANYSNGAGIVDYTYDNAMQVTKVTNKYNNNVISEYNYTYDTTGNVKTKNDGTTLTTYTYGLGNRLMSSTDRVTTGTDENGNPVYEDTVTSYTYDLDGNLTLEDITYPASYEYSYTKDGEEITLNNISRFEHRYFYDDNNRLIQVNEIILGPVVDDWLPLLHMNTTTYTYDDNGNTLTEAFDSTRMDEYTKAYTYNERNQLMGYSKDNEEVSSYTYYADGLRRSKTVGDDTTYFYYDRGNIVAEGDGTNITAQNGFGPQGIIRRKVGTDTTYYFKDAHGDVKQTIDGTTSEVTQSYTYDAYGNEANPSATDTNPFRYCGEYYDDESGLIYLRNRYYDPSTQRFITEDPAKDGMNWYAYCGGNPVMFVDPLGLYITCTEEDSKTIIPLLNEISGNSLKLAYSEGRIVILESYSTTHHVGQTLITQLVNSSQFVNITVGLSSKNQTNVKYDASEDANGIVQVYIDPEYKTGVPYATVKDSNGEEMEEAIPAFITVGHELIHAWREIYGLYDVRENEDDVVNSHYAGDHERKEEFETSGIDYSQANLNPIRSYPTYNGIICENGLRTENGLNVRAKYDAVVK